MRSTKKHTMPFVRMQTLCPGIKYMDRPKAEKVLICEKGQAHVKIQTHSVLTDQPRAPRSHCLHHYLPPCLLLCLRQMVAGSGIAPSHLRCLPACLPHEGVEKEFVVRPYASTSSTHKEFFPCHGQI